LIRISIDPGFQFSGLYRSVLVLVGFDGWQNSLSSDLSVSVARAPLHYHLPVPRTDNHHPPRASGDAFPSNAHRRSRLTEQVFTTKAVADPAFRHGTGALLRHGCAVLALQ